jgi:hypothetical protein
VLAKPQTKVPCFETKAPLKGQTMNRIDPIFSKQREAKLRYLDHEYDVITPGDFVNCAVTGDPIRIENLRYWSVEKQVAYKSAAEAFSQYRIK